MDTPHVYPDALGDALSHSSQRLAQLASLITAAATMEVRRRAQAPYAMARYVRLRAEGAGLFEAMRQAVPLFGREPHARPGDPGAERGVLESSVGLDATLLGFDSASSTHDDGSEESGAASQAEKRADSAGDYFWSCRPRRTSSSGTTGGYGEAYVRRRWPSRS